MKAYSYLRFSARHQARGDSRRRQTAGALSYCDRHGLVLDDSLHLEDEGVSAYKGRNSTTGKLAAFLRACESGQVPKGSVLIVESLDRLSRQEVGDALSLFISILNHVKIVTLNPEREHTRSSINDIAGLLEPILIMSRANEESRIKSDRLSAKWEQRRQAVREGKTTGKYRPWWLDFRDGGFVPVPERVALVRTLFTMRSQGHGITKLLKTANESGVKPRYSDKWNASTIRKMVMSRSLLGEYQPCRMVDGREVPDGEPVVGYYPAVIDADLWHRGQFPGTRRGREGTKGYSNIFKGLLRSAVDGEVMHLLHDVRQEDKRRVYRPYLISAGAHAGRQVADRTRLNYLTFEHAFLAFVSEVDPREFDRGDNADEVAELSGRVAELDHKVAAIKTRFLDEAGDEAGDNAALLDLLAECASRRRAAVAALEAARSAACDHRADAVGETKSLAALLADATPEDQRDLRVRLRQRVNALVEGITVHSVAGRRRKVNEKAPYEAYVQVRFRNGLRKWYVTDETGKLHADRLGKTVRIGDRVYSVAPEPEDGDG